MPGRRRRPGSRRQSRELAPTGLADRDHRKLAHFRIPFHLGGTACASFLPRPGGLLSVVLWIALVTRLIASFVSSLVFVFFELSLLGVVTVMRVVIASVAHTHLVVLVLRIILVVLFLW